MAALLISLKLDEGCSRNIYWDQASIEQGRRINQRVRDKFAQVRTKLAAEGELVSSIDCQLAREATHHAVNTRFSLEQLYQADFVREILIHLVSCNEYYCFDAFCRY